LPGHGLSILLASAFLGSPWFEPGPVIPVAAQPIVAVADLDGDGRDDFVLAGDDGRYELSVRLARPQGGFEVAGSYSVPGQVRRLELVDLDGDGRQDIVADTNMVVAVLRGLPDGTFTSTLERDSGGSAGVGDLTGDGLPDIAYAPSGGRTLVVASAEPDGSFTFASYPTLSSAWGVQVFDIDEDGHPDALVSHPSGWGSSLFFGGANGLGAAVEGYSGGPAFVPLTLDLDGDGDADRVRLDQNGIYLVVERRTGDDREYETHYLGGPMHTVVARDFNGDDLVDLATLVTHYEDDPELVVLPGLEGGTFGPPIVHAAADAHDSAFAAGDFDGDGNADLLVTDAGGAWGLRVWRGAAPPIALSAPASTRERELELTWTARRGARLQIRIDGPDGRTQTLEPPPRSGKARVAGWGDGRYRFRATLYAAGGAVLGTAESASALDTASTIALDPAPLPPITVGAAGTLELSVRNDGPRPATVTTVSAGERPEFELIEDRCTGKRVGAGERCGLRVRFAPAAPGPRTGSLTVATDAVFAPRTFTLTGAGFEPAAPRTRVLPPAPVAAPSIPAMPRPRLVTAQRAGRESTRVRTLRLERVATGSTVTVTCRRGCSRTSLTRRNVSGALSLTSFARRPLAAGTRLLIRVTAPGQATRRLTLTVRARKAPRISGAL
jgi:hypothetical protein